MINYFIIFPYFSGLIPILFLYVRNISETGFKSFLKVTIYYSVVFSILYIILFATIKDSYRVNIFLFSFIMIFYTGEKMYFKIIKETFARDKIVGRLEKIVVLIFIIFLFFVGFKNYTSIVYVINLIMTIITTFMVLVFTIKMSTFHYSLHKFKSNNNEDNSETIMNTKTNIPNIYYIIPDGYPSNDILKKYLDFDNSDFTSFLKDKGFHVFENAHSNYPLTTFSIGSTINMDYIDSYFDYKNIDSSIRYAEYFRTLKDNYIFKYLKNIGYDVYHAPNHWDAWINESKYINKMSYKGRQEDYFFQILLKGSLLSYFSNKYFNKKLMIDFENVFNLLKTILSIKKTSPIFFYTHLLCPHPPYFFDKDGKEPLKKLDETNIEDNKILYLGFLQYGNSKFKEYIDAILREDENAVIIIQSDHGSHFNLFTEDDWKNPTKEALEERYSVLRAVYCNNLDPSFLSNINTFRSVFNACFDEKFEMLEEKKFYTTYDENRVRLLDFEEI